MTNFVVIPDIRQYNLPFKIYRQVQPDFNTASETVLRPGHLANVLGNDQYETSVNKKLGNRFEAQMMRLNV